MPTVSPVLSAAAQSTSGLDGSTAWPMDCQNVMLAASWVASSLSAAVVL